MKRYAIIAYAFRDTPEQIEAYLPSNYRLVARGREYTMPTGTIREPWQWTDEMTGQSEWWLIEGDDNAGWTLDGYVLPRLASGLHFGKEIDLSHPIMKVVPASA